MKTSTLLATAFFVFLLTIDMHAQPRTESTPAAEIDKTAFAKLLGFWTLKANSAHVVVQMDIINKEFIEIRTITQMRGLRPLFLPDTCKTYRQRNETERNSFWRAW
jgi:hypothetical protein